MLRSIIHFVGTAILLLFAAPSHSQIAIDKSLSQSPTKDPVSVEIKRIKQEKQEVLEIEIVLNMLSGVHVYSSEKMFLKIEETEAKGLGPSKTRLPKSVKYKNFDGTTVDVFKDSQSITITRPIESQVWTFSGYLQYQACNDKICFMPKKVPFRFSSKPEDDAVSEKDHERSALTIQDDREWKKQIKDFNIAGKTVGYKGAVEFLAFLENPEESFENDYKALLGKSIIAVIFLVLLGGMALNLTPCVLPMLPITVAIIGAGAKASSRRHGFFVGGLYGLGMSIAYGTLGLIVILTGSKFGALNANPWFNLAIAVIFIILALAMFDVIQIDFTRYRSGIGGQKSGKQNLFAIFSMGIIAALLAGACVAPVVISVILYSTTLYVNGQAAGLLLPFLLGVGMAIPWPFAGAGLSFLPKPGKWMLWVKYGFGILITVIAVYYGITGLKLFKQAQKVPNIEVSNTAESSNLRWMNSLSNGLEKAKSENKPVLIDFWASWCKNCLVMDATTFKNKEVEEKLKSYVLIKYKAEQPNESPVKDVLDYFGVIGLPAYVILSSELRN